MAVAFVIASTVIVRFLGPLAQAPTATATAPRIGTLSMATGGGRWDVAEVISSGGSSITVRTTDGREVTVLNGYLELDAGVK